MEKKYPHLDGYEHETVLKAFDDLMFYDTIKGIRESLFGLTVNANMEILGDSEKNNIRGLFRFLNALEDPKKEQK